MNVHINADPPNTMGKRRSYAAVIDALRANGGWVAVSTEDVAGTTNAQKQTAIHAACGRAGIRIETHTTPTQVLIRALDSSEVQHVS